MQRGHSIEFFPEGGRSRSGKLMPPRPGIISMILRSFLGMDEKKVSFVPIAINYEKVLEEGTHQHLIENDNFYKHLWDIQTGNN